MRPEILTIKNIGPFRGTHSVNFAELGSIFLVYGKTGAGKTTLFDALAYAFYSDAPGGRKGLSRQMRSQFADDDEESVVELEFSLAGKRYRIRRSLPFDKIGVRSGKLQTVAEEVSLEFLSPEGWQNRSSTNKSETDRKILDLIGLSEEEFSRIVLLPQGEFAQFLKENSTERKAVLSKLFPVEKYQSVTALARDRARELSDRKNETVKAILALGTQFNRLSYDDDRSVLAKQTDDLRAGRSALRRELGDKAAQLEQAREIAVKQEKHRQLSVRLSELERGRSEIEAQKETALAARKAEPLMVQYSQLELLGAQVAVQTEELTLLEKELAEKTASRSELEKQNPAIEELKIEKEALLLRKDQLRIAAEIAETLDSESAELAETRKKINAQKKEITLLKEERKALDSRLSEIAGDRTAFDGRTEDFSRVRETLESQKRLRELADEYAEEKKSIAAHLGAVNSLREQLSANARDIEISSSELTDLTADSENERLGNLAGTLASRLTDGEPCPVCGSLSHPSPAVPRKAGAFSFAERIETKKRQHELLETRKSALEKTLTGRETDFRNANERLGRIIEKYCVAAGSGPQQCLRADDIPTPEAASESVREASLIMQAASDALNRARAAYRETEELTRKSADLDKRLTILKDDLAKLENTEVGQKSGIEHKKARYREAFPDESAPIDAADALEQCAARILEIEADINSHETRLSEAKDRQSALTGKKTELGRSVEFSRGKLAADTAQFAKTCAAAGFTDGEAVRRSALPDAEKTRLEGGIASFNEDLASARSGRAQLEAELALWSGPDPLKAAAEIESLDRRVTDTDRQLEEKSALLSSLDSLKVRWDELETERAGRELASSRLSSLAADLTGNNALKTSFDAWILGMYLEEITAYANTRLERMSEGRYRIQLNESYRKGNSLSGLDLEIRDAYTGKTRPSGTLSGGETFMTSISLALGLADSIQSRSGGIQLDAVFIDEGFGSLDESSLERAINILDEIRGTRMVGLISHVAELRSRIPNRIEIVKTGSGSTIKNERANGAMPSAIFQGDLQ